MQTKATTKVEKLIVVCDASIKVVDAHLPGRTGKGKAACGLIFATEEKKVSNIILESGKYLGEMTVPEAEYNGLLYALDRASEFCRIDIEVWMDSELVIRQLTGIYRLKAQNMKQLFDKVKNLEQRYKSVQYFHHGRENELAKKADGAAHQYLLQGIGK